MTSVIRDTSTQLRVHATLFESVERENRYLPNYRPRYLSTSVPSLYEYHLVEYLLGKVGTYLLNIADARRVSTPHFDARL